jgi:hypothetical protein
MVRGKFIVRDGKLTGAKGDGAYVPREKSPYAAPSGRLVTEFSPAGNPSPDALGPRGRRSGLRRRHGRHVRRAVRSLEGLDVLLCEKTDQVGGTTSTSAGTVWIPGSNQAKRDGVPDKIDEARRFLEAEIGPRALEQREAFLAAGPRRSTPGSAHRVKFVAPPMHPDYHSNQPGRALAGRALAPLPFDGRLLGKDFDRVRPPIAPFMVLGGMMVGKLDIPYLLKPFGSLANFMAAAKLLLRHATDRLRFKRGTRLVMGNALVARLFYSLRQRNVPIAYHAKLVELVTDNRRVEGAVVDIGDKRQTIRARRAVILATGGFGADTEMQKAYNAHAPVEHTTAFAGCERLMVQRPDRPAGGADRCEPHDGAFYFPSSLKGEINFPSHPARPRQARPDRREQRTAAASSTSRRAITTSSRRCCGRIPSRPAFRPG